MNSQKQRDSFAALAATILLVSGMQAQAVRPRSAGPAVPCESKIQAACDQVENGVEAFRQARIRAAIFHFSNAVAIDPTFLKARIYLGNACAQLYIPGGESPENVKLGKRAIEVFEEVLKHDADNLGALASIAQLYYSLKEFEKAKDFQQRRIKINPEDPEPYYWIGILNWAICYPRRIQVRTNLNIRVPPDPAEPGRLAPLPEGARTELAEKNLPLVEDGIEALQKAIELKPDDADAMAYLNLLYRERADLQPDKDDREADLKTADAWVERALEMMKKRHQAAPQTNVPE